MMDPEPLLYRKNVGIMLVNQYDQVFVGQRIDFKSDAWQMPQGGVDDGESEEDAAFRELYEEVGVSQVDIIAKTEDYITYDLPNELISKLWNGKFKGQEQRWFLMRLLGGDELININTEVPEFHSWKWVSLDELEDLIIPFKRDVYKRVVQEFRKYLEHTP